MIRMNIPIDDELNDRLVDVVDTLTNAENPEVADEEEGIALVLAHGLNWVECMTADPALAARMATRMGAAIDAGALSDAVALGAVLLDALNALDAAEAPPAP